MSAEGRVRAPKQSVHRQPRPDWIIRSPDVEGNVSMASRFSKIAFTAKRVETNLQISEESMSK